MSKETVENLKELVADIKDVCTCEINLKTNLRADLKFSTGDFLELLQDIEFAYDFVMSESEWLMKVISFEDVVVLVGDSEKIEL